MKILIIIISVGLLFLPTTILAQACCSAGIPLLSSLELPATPAGSWQLALTFENNTLKDVVSNSEKLNDDTRQRLTNSALLEVSYGLSKLVSVSTLLTLVQQERKIDSFGGESLLKTSGIGDAAILLKYNISPLNFTTQREIVFGLGTKYPLGNTNLKTGDILIAEDLQLGTGAWDGILWVYFYQGFLPKTRLNLVGNSSYRITGTNKRDYKFGNEFNATIGTSFRTDLFYDFSLLFRYRSTKKDQRFGDSITNTGGKWFYVIPGINLKVKKDFSVRMSLESPIYRKLNGIQLTTSYKISISLFYNLTKSKYAINI
jgi:hypothetical protein